MSISSVSGSSSSIWSTLQSITRSGLSKDDLSSLQSQSSDSTASSKMSDLINSFDKIDINGDGKIDQSEYQTYTQQMGIKGERPEGPPPEMTEDQLTEMLNNKTANGEQDELLSSLVASFDTADTDGNSKISNSEFQSFADANGYKPPETGGTPPPPPPLESTDEDEDSTNTSSTVSSSSLASLLQQYINNLSLSDEDTELLLQSIEA